MSNILNTILAFLCFYYYHISVYHRSRKILPVTQQVEMTLQKLCASQDLCMTADADNDGIIIAVEPFSPSADELPPINDLLLYYVSDLHAPMPPELQDLDDLICIDRELYILEISDYEDSPLDTFALLQQLGKGSRLASLIPSFTARDEQLAMLEQIALSFNSHQLCITEAGTGTGKSFAYLFAALSYVQQNKGRIVISTATITLQQQLIEKDIPIVQQALASDIPVALVKGKTNYLCQRQSTNYDPGLYDDANLKSFSDWAATTETGDRSEAPFISEAHWQDVAANADSCFMRKCPNKERCFLRRARERAHNARILVTNHHLLISDLIIRHQGNVPRNINLILPPIRHIIFDEAHTLEDRITHMFSVACSPTQLRQTMQQLFSKKHNIRAWLVQHKYETGLRSAVEKVDLLLDTLSDYGLRCLNNEDSFWLQKDWSWKSAPENFGAFGNSIQDCKEALNILIGLADQFYQKYSGEEEEDSLRDAILHRIIEKLRAAHAILDSFIAEDRDQEMVYWLGKTTKGSNFSLSPLNTAPLMQKLVLDNYETIVFCSASLRVGNSFDFWKQALGIDSRKGEYAALPSPFMHRAQVLIVIPSDAPDPNHEDYADYLCRLIVDSVRASGGGALILFTSYQSMHRSYKQVVPDLEGISCLMQGDDERHRLLEKFREQKDSILFATDSFWEGIDAPGETLRLLIICRLPFRHPSDPISKARNAAIEEGGGNPFMQQTLPTAVLRFKQGFGRLIRSEHDRGAVVLADSRIQRKSYGRVFQQSIPQCQRITVPVKEVPENLTRFFNI